jgi:hypothetical protein
MPPLPWLFPQTPRSLLKISQIQVHFIKNFKALVNTIAGTGFHPSIAYIVANL